MTREEAIKLLVNATYSDEWQGNEDLTTAHNMAIEALQESPCEDTDIKLIHTGGLDEGIRCAMCTNSMKSDRGCDGGCVVNESMYKKVLGVVEEHMTEQESILDQIKAEIKMYEADCRLQGDTDECEKCNSNVFGSIYRIIDKYKAGSRSEE